LKQYIAFLFHIRQLQDKFVALLRLLLLWDPQARGGSVLESGKKECFDVLEKIINTVVILFIGNFQWLMKLLTVA